MKEPRIRAKSAVVRPFVQAAVLFLALLGVALVLMTRTLQVTTSRVESSRGATVIADPLDAKGVHIPVEEPLTEPVAESVTENVAVEAPPRATADAVSSSLLPAAVPPVPTSGMQLRVPRFGVAARVQEMGFDRNTGVMEIPREAALVAWYRFTAHPGEPGNAVVAAHVNYAGVPGPFSKLHQLNIGDEVLVESGSSSFRYRVFETYLVRAAQADMDAIIGSRAGTKTLTLITCGGVFNSQQRAYEERVIVRAEQIRNGS